MLKGQEPKKALLGLESTLMLLYLAEMKILKGKIILTLVFFFLHLFYFILFLNLKHCISFAKHQNKSKWWYETQLQPWVGKILWRRESLPTPVSLPGESPRTEEPNEIQGMGSQRVGHDWATNTFTTSHTPKHFQRVKKKFFFSQNKN